MNLQSVIQNEVRKRKKKNGTDKPVRGAGIETRIHREQPAGRTGEGKSETD